MKKLVLIFCAMILMLPLPVDAARKKVLYITSNGGTAATGTPWVNAVVHRMERSLGYDFKQLLASDTTAVQTAFASGEYDLCIPVNLPDFTASFDTHAEIVAAGWGNLDEWVAPNHSNHCDIPVLMLLPGTMVTSGVWATAYTGVLGSLNGSGTSSQSLTSASGDSFYVNIHWDTATGLKTRIADSLSWCDAVIWNQTAVAGSDEQKYALIWRTVATNGQSVYYIKNAHASWVTGYVAALIGAYVDVTPVEIPILLEYGWADKDVWARKGGTIDTIGSEYCMGRIIDYVREKDMKLEILIDQTMLKSQLKGNMTRPINRMLLYPDNFRITHWTRHSARTGNYDWFSVLTTWKASQMANAISLTFASTNSDTLLAGSVDSSLAKGYWGMYAGGFGATAVRVDSVLNVAVDAGITDLYTYGNSTSGELPSYTGNYGTIGTRRSWVGNSHKELRQHALVRLHYAVLAASGTNSYPDSSKICYMARFASYRGTYAAQALKTGFGGYVVDKGTALSISATPGYLACQLHGAFSAGYVYDQSEISGGSNTGGGYVLAGIDSTKSVFADNVLTDWYAQVSTMNDIVDRYGTTGRDVFIWAWADEVKRDRKLGRAWINSHVSHIAHE